MQQIKKKYIIDAPDIHFCNYFQNFKSLNNIKTM